MNSNRNKRIIIKCIMENENKLDKLMRNFEETLKLSGISTRAEKLFFTLLMISNGNSMDLNGSIIQIIKGHSKNT